MLQLLPCLAALIALGGCQVAKHQVRQVLSLDNNTSTTTTSAPVLYPVAPANMTTIKFTITRTVWILPPTPAAAGDPHAANAADFANGVPGSASANSEGASGDTDGGSSGGANGIAPVPNSNSYSNSNSNGGSNNNSNGEAVNSEAVAPTGAQNPTSAAVASSAASPTGTGESDWPDHTVTGYYGAGNINDYPPEQIPWEYLTHLCYAFAKTSGAASNYSITYNSTLLSYLSTQAQAHGTKLVLSLGGYGEGGQYFSEIVQSNASLGAFVSSVKTTVNTFNIAGIDIDWEFVGDLKGGLSNNLFTDANGYLSMLQLMRSTMPQIELSAAVPAKLFYTSASANSTQAINANMEPFVPLFDRVYLMNYDFWNVDPGEPGQTAGSNGALGPQRGSSIDPSGTDFNDSSIPYNEVSNQLDFGVAAVGNWNNAGFPMSKLVWGVPFYGIGWNLTNGDDPSNTTYGLYSPTEGHSVGDQNEGVPQTQDDPTGFWKWSNLLAQNVLVPNDDGTYGPGDGWQQGFDAGTQTPYVWNANATNPQIISYDDPNSITLKRTWAKQHGMNGMMFWAMYCDTKDGQLTQVLA